MRREKIETQRFNPACPVKDVRSLNSNVYGMKNTPFKSGDSVALTTENRREPDAHAVLWSHRYFVSIQIKALTAGEESRKEGEINRLPACLVEVHS